MHFQTAVVGSQDSGVLLPESFLQAHRHLPRTAGEVPEVRRSRKAGRGYSRYMVQLRAVAFLHPRLAGQDPRDGLLLSDKYPGYGL